MDINSIATTALPSASRSQQSVSRTEPVATELGGQSPQAPGQPLGQAAQAAEQPIENAVSSIQQFVQTVQRNLNFSLDDSTGRVVVKVTDGASGEVIRQIPSEEALRLAESLEQARSLLFRAEA